MRLNTNHIIYNIQVLMIAMNFALLDTAPWLYLGGIQKKLLEVL